MPARPVLDAEMILAATEDMLRRHGPGKAGVVDVARSLGVSHAAVYRHFPSKDALRAAVIQRWLDRGQDELDQITGDPHRPAPDRLRAWFHALLALKQRKVVAEPELQATLRLLAAEGTEVGGHYVVGLLDQIRSILQAGIDAGQFAPTDAPATAKALFDATFAFHHFELAEEWLAAGTAERLDAVLTLLIRGLGPQSPARP